MPRISAAQRRGDFIKAAVEVIAVYGIEGATTRRIAEQAQANLAMLHYCYDSKEDLFADVYEFVAGRYRDALENNASPGDVAETARRLLRGVMECYLESASFAMAAMELISWARRQHGDRGIAVYDKALETVRTALRDAGSDHPIEPEIVEEIAFVIAALADGFAANWLTYGDRSAALGQMELATSVLDSWLAARLGSTPVAPSQR
ncbi:TetR/AcrR family transcriptional regulator [Amycolatopsis sp. NPDC102389]|uniref:TetR/AcrR family transcriptional regulator n=1 Tax=Amycolatopsis sp. NPDC102389 TaxID=3363941 RepID=UPI00381CB73D